MSEPALADRGRDADAPHEIPARGWKDIAVRVKDEARDDNVSLLSAGVAFFAVLSLAPALAALVSIYGLVASPDDIVRQVEDLSSTVPQEAKDQFGITAEQGAVVNSVDPDSGAASAGLQVGDVITSFDGEAVTGSTQLTKLVRAHEPGDQVSVQVERRGERQTLTVTLGP